MGEGLSEFVLMCAVAALRWALLGGTHWSFAGNKRRARRAWRKAVAEASALAAPYERCLVELEPWRHTRGAQRHLR